MSRVISTKKHLSNAKQSKLKACLELEEAESIEPKPGRGKRVDQVLGGRGQGVFIEDSVHSIEDMENSVLPREATA